MQRPAFTLIEFLVVITIIAILAAGASIGFSQSYRSLLFNNTVEAALNVFRTARSYATSSRIIEGDLPPVGFSVFVNAGAGTMAFRTSSGACSDTTGSVLTPSFSMGAGASFAMELNVGSVSPSLAGVIFRVPYGDVVLCGDTDGDPEIEEVTSVEGNDFQMLLFDPLLPSRQRRIAIDRVSSIPEVQ